MNARTVNADTNFDLAVRAYADSTDLYFLFKFNNITDIDLPYAVSVLKPELWAGLCRRRA